MKKRLRFSLLCLGLCISVMSALLSGCSSTDEQVKGDGQYYLYYSNSAGTALNTDVFTPGSSRETSAIAREMLLNLSKNTSNPEKTKTIPDDVKATFSQVKGRGYVDFSSNYGSVDKIQDAICRSSIVLTLTQIEDVKSVTFTIDGKEMSRENGEVIGPLTSQNFADNSSKLINSFNRATIVLYFANDAGDKLVPYRYDSVLSNNISMEQYVVDKLIEGPSVSGYYPTISDKVKVDSVYTKDGICYVDFDETFLSESLDIRDDITIYSITNTLSELSNVSQVQFLVNGEAGILYHNVLDLSEPFVRNLDYVEQTTKTIKETVKIK